MRMMVKLAFIDPETKQLRDQMEVEAKVGKTEVETSVAHFNRETGEPIGNNAPLRWRLAQGEIARINQTFLPEGWEDTKPRVRIRETPVERVRIEKPRVRVEESSPLKRVRIK